MIESKTSLRAPSGSSQVLPISPEASQTRGTGWNLWAQPGESRRRLIQIATLGALYVATGRLGLSVAHYQDNATLIWPPTGLALAALIVYGRRLWPGVALGALILNVAVGTAWSTSIGIALGNTLEAVVGAFLLERATGFRSSLSRVRDVAAFLLIGAVGSTLVSAAVGVTALYLGGELGNSAVSLVFLIWWLGDVGGAVVFAPILRMPRRWRPGCSLEPRQNVRDWR